MNEQNKDTVTLPREVWKQLKEMKEYLEKTQEIFEKLEENGLSEEQTEAEEPKKPTLDDYTTIKTYEDACEALGVDPLPYHFPPIEERLNESQCNWRLRYIPSHIIALMKLETISRALWGREWKPEICEHDIFSPTFKEGNYYGTYVTNDDTVIADNLRLCQQTCEKASYFGRQFLPLWAEYLGFETEKEGGEQ